jgi:hypothetical protein
LAHDRHLTRLFLRRFVENDLISPDADRLAVLSQTGGVIISGGLFVTILLSLGYLASPFPLPGRTAVQMLRVQFLYTTWSMIVMALVAVSAWDAVALDSRDTLILGPLPLARGVIVRAKILALTMFSAGFAGALNVAPAIIHPVFAVSRLRPSLLAIATLIAAHLVSTTGAAAFGFAAVIGLRELLHAIFGTGWFRRISLVVQAGLVVALLTMLLLVPGFSFRVADQWLARGNIDANLLPPFWFVGIHDMLSGHIWEQLPPPVLPRRVATSEAAFSELYRNRRPLLRQLGLTGSLRFLAVLLCSAAAYLWNNRRLPDPPSPRTMQRGPLSAILSWIARALLARRPLVRAGFFFTIRVLGHSVQNRLSIGIALAVAIAVSTVSLRLAGVGSSLDSSTAPNAFFAIQILLVAALVSGFRHSVRVPAELRARWLFHVVQPANQSVYLEGAKRAALVKLILPMQIALLPLHVLALGWQMAATHFAYDLLIALILVESSLLEYRRLPFASSYVPVTNLSTHGPILAIVFLGSVYTLAWLERLALSTPRGTATLFGISAIVLAVVRGVDAWQRRERADIELDEIVDPPTLRLGLME